MSEYRIIEIEYSSGRTEYRVDCQKTEPSMPKDKDGIAFTYWVTEGMHTSKVEATSHIDLLRSRKADITVVKTTELDDKGEAKGGK